MSKPKVYIIILNWNRSKLTGDCLKSIQKLHKSNMILKTIVVDNNSTKEQEKELRSLIEKNTKFSIKLMINDKNLGFAGGNNTGIKYALKNNADYVLILNNDTELDKDLLQNLIKAAKQNKNSAVFSPKIYFAPGFEFHKKRYKKRDLGKVLWAAGGEIDWKNVYATNRGVDQVDEGQFNESIEVDFASGACMFVNTKILKKVGVFDESYFMYLEDTDLCQRIKQSGKSILYVHDAEVWHKVAQSSKIGSDLNDYFITRNRLQFGMMYAPIRAKIPLLRESLRLWKKGRKWQKIGVKDFYTRNLGLGSWKNE